jgi:hypothetical protein
LEFAGIFKKRSQESEKSKEKIGDSIFSLYLCTRKTEIKAEHLHFYMLQ